MMQALTKTATTIGDKVSDVKETVEDIARSAGRKLDEARDETADRLHTAASSVRTSGRQGAEAIDRIAKGTANKLDSAADYVEECDLRGVLGSLRQFSRRHLTGSLLAAAAIGFLAGSALKRGSRSRARATVS